MPIEHLFKTTTLYLAMGVEAAAATIIGLAAIVATFRALVAFFRRSDGAQPQEHIRLSLGRWLGLGLEFLLAADILRTAVAPTWDEIGKLAAIIVLRTLLNYFLQREITAAGHPRS